MRISQLLSHRLLQKAKARLTARPTSRAGAKAGHSDPVVLYGRAIAQRIKGTLGDRKSTRLNSSH